ncbi:hypothetical protein HK101_002062 [Irineochytrium annulatum]|nr:hypothetical protein HK101_002062 [Irineochytrium annulatum]
MRPASLTLPRTIVGLLAVVALLACGATAVPVSSGSSGKIVTIEGPRSFCLLLPAVKGQTVGDSEGSAKAKCFGSASTPGSSKLPDGAIKSAHYVKTAQYHQVTGMIDEDLLGISQSDGGGQYDNAPHGSEPSSGAVPSPFNYYVEIVESGRYCMRTCTTSGQDESSPCNMHRDTAGCNAVIGGNYGPGFD